MKKSVFLPALTLILSVALNTAFGQCKDWKWPEDAAMKVKAEEKISLYSDYQRNGEFRKAAPPLFWLLTNTPDLNTSIYINGVDIYDNLAEKETDPAKKKVYIDSALLLYDLRIKYCGEEANVMNRKAITAAKFYANEKGKEEYVLQLMDKAFELNGNDIFDGTLVTYMQVILINKLKLKKLTTDQILERYDNLMKIIDSKAAASGNAAKYKPYKEKIDDFLIRALGSDVNCDFVRTKLGPKFKANPNDIDLAKKIFTFMLKDKCTDDPLWLQAAELIHKTEKDCGLSKNLGIRYLAMEDFAKAETYLNEALEICSEGTDKADVYIYLGAIEAKKGSKSSAREMYRKALAADPSRKEAYEKIGDLYMTSFDDCKKENSYAEDRLVYLAAYDMYAKSGNGGKMAQAKAQFPSTTELFEQNWKEGDTKRVDCWVGETVVLRTRGKD